MEEQIEIDSDKFLTSESSVSLCDYLLQEYSERHAGIDFAPPQQKLVEVANVYGVLSRVIASFSKVSHGRAVWYQLNKADKPFRCPTHEQKYGVAFAEDGTCFSKLAAQLHKPANLSKSETIYVEDLINDAWLSLSLGFVGHGAMSKYTRDGVQCFARCIIDTDPDEFRARLQRSKRMLEHSGFERTKSRRERKRSTMPSATKGEMQ